MGPTTALLLATAQPTTPRCTHVDQSLHVLAMHLIRVGHSRAQHNHSHHLLPPAMVRHTQSKVTELAMLHSTPFL